MTETNNNGDERDTPDDEFARRLDEEFRRERLNKLRWVAVTLADRVTDDRGDLFDEQMTSDLRMAAAIIGEHLKFCNLKHPKLTEPDGRDAAVLLGMLGVAEDGHAPGSTWDEKRRLSKLRGPHTRRAVQTASRAIHLARLVSAADPESEQYREVVDLVDQAWAGCFQHGRQREYTARMAFLSQIDEMADFALAGGIPEPLPVRCLE